jgi:hypothetical protein
LNPNTPPEHAWFEVAVEPAPRAEVVEAEEDEDSKRKRDAALASTFDQSLAHHGKSDEEMIEERQDEARLIVDAAIVAGIAIAVTAEQSDDGVDATIVENASSDGDDDGGD